MSIINFTVLEWCYRVITVVFVVVFGALAITNLDNTGAAVLRFIAQLLTVLFWASILWSCPSLISGVWERNLPNYVWSFKPSVALLPVVVLCVLVGGLGMFVIGFFMVVLLFPNLTHYAIVVASLGMMLVTVPMLIGTIRVFVHMRSSNPLS